jgi:hypothetical protein
MATNCALELSWRSQFFQSLQCLSSQPKERSTTQHKGKLADTLDNLHSASLSTAKAPVLFACSVDEGGKPIWIFTG